MSKILKDIYKDYFKIGVACEKINGHFTNHEIGNPDKEALMLKHFNSMTFGNELKPAYNMGFDSPEAREDYLPFRINPTALEMLVWARENKMPVRGHVMVWHSQCAREAFCKEYKPVTIPTDPELLKENPMLKHFEKLDPVCFVDRDTMLKRLESYIFSLVEYMYREDFARTVYAWDVVNEAIELEDKTPTGLRNSYWYQIIGDDFIYWSFKFAHDAVEELSVKYADKYGINPDDAEALKEIKPILFYNDYNEMDPAKKKAIIDMLYRETGDHGSIIGEGLLGGIGMQGHISDNNDIPRYIEALHEYSKIAPTVHITELDVKCTCTNVNAEYYQAVFYKKFFEELIKANKEGAKLSVVTFWGLTDDNSWIRGANPLLFHGDLSEKKAFDALVYAVEGGSLGDPEPVYYDLSDRHYDFEDGSFENTIFKMVGFGRMNAVDSFKRTGKFSLGNEKRFGSYSNIGMDVSDFIGQTIDIEMWVSSPANKILLKADGQGDKEFVAAVDTKEGEWSLLKAHYKVPGDVHSMTLRLETEEPVAGKFSAQYVDECTIKLIGLEESFEDETNIAAIRGMGHLPFLRVTDKEAVAKGQKSLLVTRHEKDATVKFGISQFIGKKVNIRAFVKTEDEVIKMGLEAGGIIKLTEVPSLKGGWTEVSAVADIPENLISADFYIETDGNRDMYIDDILVTLA